MRRLLSFLFVSIVFCSALAFAGDTFTVSGEVKFPKNKGVIQCWLRTQEEFEKREKPASPARRLMIKPSPQQLEAKKVTFKFVDVPKGIYMIICIQDLNNNGEMDYSTAPFGRKIPLEPFGYSGPRLPGLWDDVKFEVEKDISGIEIQISG